ncbi:MAG: GGDEF domain-containing protein [Myxococcales bacterium]|nr:GGDEF domain-containing protein [Myxococcales bacterium]
MRIVQELYYDCVVADATQTLHDSPPPHSVLVIDFDHFKLLNELYGTEACDEALQEFFRHLRAATRDRDELVRRASDEFVVTLANTDLESARIAAERIRHAMEEQPIALSSGQLVTQTVSIGVATWDGAESSEDLELRADEAMLAAKASGRNRVHAVEKRSLTNRPTLPPSDLAPCDEDE